VNHNSVPRVSIYLYTASSQRCLFLAAGPSGHESTGALLRVHTFLILASDTELNRPGDAGQEHDSGRDPSDGQILATLVGVDSDIVAVLVDDACEFPLRDGDYDGWNEESHE